MSKKYQKKGTSPVVAIEESEIEINSDKEKKNSSIKEANGGSEKGKDDKGGKKLNKSTIWAIKITLITLALSFIFSFVTEIASSKFNVVIALIFLILLIGINVVFDGIGVAATSCDLAPLLSMAARKVPGARVAVILVKNAEKVSNICADVIGDICSIISGACTISIMIKLAANDPNQYIYNIILSALVAAFTVGGKAILKSIGMKNSKELMLFAGRVLSVFFRKKK